MKILKELWIFSGENGVDTILGKTIAVIGSILGFLFGGWHEILTILLVAQALDVLTGFMKQQMFMSLSSKEMYDGLLKKFSVWIVIVLAHMIELILFKNGVLVTGAAMMYFANESLSVVENLGEMGIIVPKNMVKYLKQVREKSEVD